MISAHCIIHRVNLDIEAQDEPTARRMQNEAGCMLYKWIIPKLEELLDRLAPKDVVLRIDKLDLDFASINKAQFEQGFDEAVLNRLSEQIEQVVAATSGESGKELPEPLIVLTEDERNIETFLHFLATGRLPWWSEREPAMFEEAPLATLLERIIGVNLDTAAKLVSLLATQTRALERLLLQFSPAFVFRFIQQLLFKLGPQSGEEFARLAETILYKLAGTAENDPAIRERLELLHDLLGWLIDAQTLPDYIAIVQLREYVERPACRCQKNGQCQIGSLIKVPVLPPLVQPCRRLQDEAQKETEASAELEKDGVHVEHAGLVLLHPFLEYYFREFDLLDDKEFRDDNARCLAIHLLHHLATGQETPPEYLLTFEKFLCGIELLAPLPRFVELSTFMKEESETLLRAAIGHWKTLKNTSSAGLREGFLQRPGKLIFSSFENRLIIETKSHDVLLGYLPWGYGIIKLPWLSQPLFVDWGN